MDDLYEIAKEADKVLTFEIKEKLNLWANSQNL
jgi:hypothetical protein